MGSKYQILSQDEVEALHSAFTERLKDRARKFIPSDAVHNDYTLSLLTENLLAAARQRIKIDQSALPWLARPNFVQMDNSLRKLVRALQTDHFSEHQYDTFEKAAAARKEDPAVQQLFGDRTRIYLKCDVDADSKIRKEIERKLARWGYTITSYKDGYATDAAGKQKFKIGKLLKEHEELRKKFENDPVRAGDTLVVISRDTMDIARMSTNRGWKSCMATDGDFSNYLPTQIRDGALVAYLISSRDPEINDPLARITIKSYDPHDDKKALHDTERKINRAEFEANSRRTEVNSLTYKAENDLHMAEQLENLIERLSEDSEGNKEEIEAAQFAAEEHRRMAQFRTKKILPKAIFEAEKMEKKHALLKARFNRISARLEKEKDVTGYAYAVSTTYGMGHDSFRQVVADFVEDHLNNGKRGTFRLRSGMYNDNDDERILVRGKRPLRPAF